MDQLPEWTPGPGKYELPTDFNKKTLEKIIPAEVEEQPDMVMIVAPWDQKGYG